MLCNDRNLRHRSIFLTSCRKSDRIRPILIRKVKRTKRRREEEKMRKILKCYATNSNYFFKKNISVNNWSVVEHKIKRSMTLVCLTGTNRMRELCSFCPASCHLIANTTLYATTLPEYFEIHLFGAGVARAPLSQQIFKDENLTE